MKKLLSLWYTILYQFEQHRNDIPEWWYAQKPFEQKPDWLQRVTIAQDVIAQINAQILIPNTGKYVEEIRRKSGKKYWRTSDEDVKSNYADIESCEVCALGACLMSITKFKNRIKFYELDEEYFQKSQSQSPVTNLLKSIFSPEQLALIEIAFEQRSYIIIVGIQYMYAELSDEEQENAVNFGYNRGVGSSASERLKAIMQNIIDNKGTFKP